MTPRHRALAVLVTIIWGVNFVVIDEGLRDVPPLVLTALRFLACARYASGASARRPSCGSCSVTA